MNKYNVNISFEYEDDADSDDEAQDQALDCADWGDADIDIQVIEEGK